MKGPLLAEGRTAEVFVWGETSILKLYRDWCPPDWADYEQKIALKVNELGISAPRFEERIEVDGRPGLIYERAPGRSMVEIFPEAPHKIPAYARQMAELHIEMHLRTIDGLGTVRDGLRRSISRAPHLSEAQREAILERLERLPDDNRLCHMDFHPGQVLVSGQGAVVLDWMTVRQGHPAADVARTCLMARVGRSPGLSSVMIVVSALAGRLFEASYLKRYLALSDKVTREDVTAWMLPVMAARLNEEIAHETATLLRMIARGLKEGN